MIQDCLNFLLLNSTIWFVQSRVKQTWETLPAGLTHNRNRTVCSYWNDQHEGLAGTGQAGGWTVRVEGATLEVTVVVRQRRSHHLSVCLPHASDYLT